MGSSPWYLRRRRAAPDLRWAQFPQCKGVDFLSLCLDWKLSLVIPTGDRFRKSRSRTWKIVCTVFMLHPIILHSQLLVGVLFLPSGFLFLYWPADHTLSLTKVIKMSGVVVYGYKAVYLAYGARCEYSIDCVPLCFSAYQLFRLQVVKYLEA